MKTYSFWGQRVVAAPERDRSRDLLDDVDYSIVTQAQQGVLLAQTMIAMAQRPDPASVEQLSGILGQPCETVSGHLSILCQDGLAVRHGPDQFELSDLGQRLARRTASAPSLD